VGAHLLSHFSFQALAVTRDGNKVQERAGMARYQLEIFNPYQGMEPVLKQEICAADDKAAVIEANRRYDELAEDVKLAGFVLYEGTRVVSERPRWMR
jgi:hypothetical protein